MKNNRSSLSKSRSYKEIGEYWDRHDLGKIWGQTKSAKFEVDIASEETYYSLDRFLSDQLRRIAKQRGVSPDTLINLWVQEQVQRESPSTLNMGASRKRLRRANHKQTTNE